MSFLRKLRSNAVLIGVNLLVVLALLELGLRMFPQLVPLGDLIKFQSSIKSEIAERRGLPRFATMQTVVRDDGGPTLTVYGPNATVNFPEKDVGATTSVQLDQRGFCNPPDAAPNDRSDVVVIGDSFTFCLAVKPEETWSAGLARRTGKRAYNLGRVGIGIYEYQQIFKAYGIKLSPRTVVMNFYEGNDLRDVQRYREAEHGMDDAPENMPERKYWILDHSYIAALIAAKSGYKPAKPAGNSGRKSFLKTLKKRYKNQDFTYDLHFADTVVPFNVENADVDEALYVRALSDGLIEPALWESVREGLRAYVVLAKKHGFKPVVSYTPSAYTAYAGAVRFHDESLSKAASAYSRAQRDFLRQEASRIGYVFVDLTPALQAAAMTKGASALLYRPHNVHLSPEGHAVIAEALSAVVASAR